MRTITTILTIVFTIVFSVTSATAQTATATKLNDIYFTPTNNILNMNVDTSNVNIMLLPTKGSRIYIEMAYTYTAKDVHIDKLNTLASVVYQSKRYEITYQHDILKIEKIKNNVIFITNVKGEKIEVKEEAVLKIYVPEKINYVGM